MPNQRCPWLRQWTARRVTRTTEFLSFLVCYMPLALRQWTRGFAHALRVRAINPFAYKPPLLPRDFWNRWCALSSKLQWLLSAAIDLRATLSDARYKELVN